MNLGIHMKNTNKFLSLMVFVFLLSATSFAFAENIKLKPGHPEKYTVVKGDTLWDISGKFLSKPWYWPEIWQVNTQIENPHLIYPGDVLRLIYIDGKPYITRDGRKRLSPRVRVEDLDQAISTIPLDIIAPYLTENLLIDPGEYAGAPYIVDINDGHLSAGADNSIYVMGIDENTNDTNYAVYKQGQVYKNPANKREILGYEAIFLGEGVLEHRGSPATVYIEKSKAEILKGNRVIPNNRNMIVEANFMPKASLVNRPGTIVGVLTNGMQPGVHMVGAMDVVVIDMGNEDGAEAGGVLNIFKNGGIVKDPLYANKSVRLPNELAGNVMIFRTFKRLSYALVMDAQDVLRVGDYVKSERSSY